VKQLLLMTVLFFGFFSTSIAQKSDPTTKKNTHQRSSPNCPLSVSIQDNIPSAVCSELLKTLVAITDPCTDTTAVNYRWSSSVGGVFSTARTTTFNLPEFIVATPVTFTVWVIEGTDSLSADYTITVKPRPSRPTLTPFGTIILCDNNSITLTSSACTSGSTTIWSNGAFAVSSISVPAIGGTYFKVACEKNGCVSDSTAAAALITGTVTASPTVTNRTICEGTTITTGNGLQAQLVNCNNGASGTYTYNGPTVGYDRGYVNVGGVDPSVTVASSIGIVKKVSVSITWRKQKGGYQNDCGVGDTESWPYHNETQFKVKSPSGKIITLVNTYTYGGSNNPTVTTVFEDGALPVNFYSPPVSGIFAPAQPLSGFIGENSAGTWTLLPYDAVGKDPLCVSGFSVTFSEAQNGTITWWDAPTGGNQVGTGSEFIPTNTAAGTHTYYAQGQCVRGCPSVRTVATLEIKPAPVPLISVNVPEVNGARKVCFGDSITLTATGCIGTVRWSGNYLPYRYGSSIKIRPEGGSYFEATNNYVANCEGTNGCVSLNSNTITVLAKIKPFKPTISGPGNSVCLNSTITLTASACSGGTVGWTGNRSGSSISFVITSAVNIKVACTINGCTSDSSDVYSMAAFPKPATPTVNASQIQALCLGDGVTLSANCANGTTVKWTGNLTGSPITVYPTSTRSYRASCLGTSGCSSDSSAALNIVILQKTKPTITGSAFVCGTGAAQTASLSATGCSGANETVMWRNGDVGTTYSEAITQTKTFRAICIRNGYCISDSSDIFTVQYRTDLMSAPTVINATICEGVSLTAGNGLKATGPQCTNGSTSTTANYTGGTVGYDGGSVYGTNPTAVIAGASGTISNVRISMTWLKKSTSGTISCGAPNDGGDPYHSEISFRLQAPDGTIVNVINAGTYGGTISNTVTTIFENGNPPVSSGASPVSGSFSPVSSFTILNGKNANGIWTLLPNDAGIGDILCVSGFSVTITTTGIPSTLTWWDAQTGGTQVATGSEYVPTTNTLASGVYTYYVQAACTGQCPSPRAANTLTVIAKPNAPIITPPTNNTICKGSNITLSAAGCTGGTYAWTGGLTGSSISVSPSSTKAYKVACTLNTCTSDSSSAVPINVYIGTSQQSIKTGDWADPSTWSCNRVPLSSDTIKINANHIITITNGIAYTKYLINNGQLNFANSTCRLAIGEVRIYSYISQPDPNLGKDADVSSYDPNTNYGNSTLSSPMSWTISNIPITKRFFVSFDITSIPTNAIIDSAYLSLYFSQSYIDAGGYYSGHSGNNAFFIRRVTSNWQENTITWNNQPSMSQTNQVNIPYHTNARQHYPKMNIKNLVADMVANPASSFGFGLQHQVEETYKITLLTTSDDINYPDFRPKLAVYYRLP
jgi:Ig-like domain CHU_C associated